MIQFEFRVPFASVFRRGVTAPPAPLPSAAERGNPPDTIPSLSQWGGVENGASPGTPFLCSQDDLALLAAYEQVREESLW